ncbi:UPF0481 protein-like protein [Tanacetum coccineum]
MAQSHVITINEEIELMTTKLQEPPKLLHKLAGKDSCCIFRLPQSLVEINKEAYRPRIVSIGPYHNGNKDLDMIQEHKWRFLNDLITRSGKPLDVYMEMMVSMEGEIRKSYSESIDQFSTTELAKMMVLDGVFLIELFRKVGKLVDTDRDDPIFRMVWVSPFLMRDLLKIENQIPFFVLQKLFDASSTNIDSAPTLRALILEFFNYLVDRQPEVLKGRGKAIVEKPNHPPLKLILPATKLVIKGVKFKPNHQAESFLDIEFKNGFLLIPQINMDDFYSSFFLNCVAFEQCYSHCSKDITTYVVFMGCLMNTSTDVGLLSEKKIIENYFGTDKEIAKFFKNVGKDVAFDIRNNYLIGLFRDLNSYCKNGWHVGLAGFKHTYFSSPWAAISAIAAFMLLSLAALQTFFTVFPTKK